MPPTLTPNQFIDKWRSHQLNERSAYQQHFLDLCALLSHPTPAEYDPAGLFFRFEAGASKVSGGEGFADVWYKDHFAWEYKGPHANLDKAYSQLLQYREALDNPPLLIVSDTDQIQIHTNFTGTPKRRYILILDDLLKPDKLDLLRRVFFDPYSFREERTPEEVTQDAAAKFAQLAEVLRRAGHDPHAAAHFLIRLLFCMFAEDVGLIPNAIFTKLALNFRAKPEIFSRQLGELFAQMASGGYFGFDRIPHFDGKLFDDAAVLDLGREGLDILVEVSTLNWGNIEPSIFGTLFERSLDPAKRSQLGAHYTSKEDILLIVEPVLMAPLRRKWAALRSEAEALAAARAGEKGPKRAALDTRLQKLFIDFSRDIAATKVLDPACGSGNFLYLALRQLLNLEKEVIDFAARLGVGRFFPSVSPAQLHGIEINETAHQLAQATIQIGYIQWLRENGFGFPSEPILRPLDTIRCMDAILAWDEAGKPYEPEWPAVDVIIGNPPFLGGSKFRRQLGENYVKALWPLYKDRVPNASDLVCYWFEKSRYMIEIAKAKRAGLLATQSIRMGASRSVLDAINQTGSIFWAQSDRGWILDGASVRVSMVGFTGKSAKTFELNNKIVEKINSDLSSNTDTTFALPLGENKHIGYRSDEKGGPFDINEKTAAEMIAESLNPHNRHNSEVVRPYYNAQDITQRWSRTWIIDFGCDISIDQASLFELPFEYVKRVVKPIRDLSSDPKEKMYWWLHRRPAPDMRLAIATLSRYIGTPRVAKHRIFVWLEKGVIPDSRIYVFSKEDDYFFGILHSVIHQIWSLATSSRHGVGNDPTYNLTTCFETFPFPWPPGKEPAGDPRVEAVAELARELVRLRDNWLNPPGASEPELKKRTLTNLYNQRPTWLDNAHRKLDRAVFAAYGWEHGLGDEEILERLLALNLERSKPR